VVGALNVVPAAADGLPGIVAALKTARVDTFAALNAPIVADPTPTVMPNGVVQVAVIGAMNVVAAVIFPAFNDGLRALTEVPNAVAQELAATGNPVLAIAAGANSAAGLANAAVTVVKQAVVTAVDDVRDAAGQAHPGALTRIQRPSTTATPMRDSAIAARSSTTADKQTATGTHVVRDAVSKVRNATRNDASNAADRPHHPVSKKGKG
jgi:hypothetical protein